MTKQPKTFRPKARLPKGLHDERGPEIAAQRRMIETIAGVFELCGFEPLSTPAIEYADALGKFLPDQDRPNEGVFSFQDDDEQWLSLRYDLTAPLARFVAENYDALPKPFRRYQSGKVWRNEKPGPGRFREFMQIDADTVGSASMAADAEMIAMMAECVERLGIARGQYIVKVNNRKILNGVSEARQIDPAKQSMMLRAMDKRDRVGIAGMYDLLRSGRKDVSGDFTLGASLTPSQVQLVVEVSAAPYFISNPSLSASDLPSIIQIEQAASNVGDVSRNDLLDYFEDKVGQTVSGREGIDELREIDRILGALGIGNEQVIFDPSVVRGLGYYTGPVWEVELTFETKNEDGDTVRFGSVGSGGRYDGLVKMFKGIDVPATGCSFGVSRLAAALTHLGRSDERDMAGPVVVLVMDGERVADYQIMVQELRKAGVRAELYLGGGGMRAQLKYADKRGAPVAVIEGEDERARGEVTLKDLRLGAERAADIADNEEWRSGEAAQETVARQDVVAAVKKTLARPRGRG